MSRQRSIRYPLAFLTAAIGVAVPSTVRAADGDAGAAVPAADEAPEPVPPPAPEPEPEPEPTVPPAPAPEPTPPTTVPPPPDTTPPPAPEPDPAPEPPLTEPPTTEPPTTEPPIKEPAADPEPEPEPETPAPDEPTGADPVRPSSPRDTAPARGDREPAVRGIDGITRPISFPVLGAVSYSNDWGACRDDCARHHEGTDVLGVRMQPLLAAVDGTVTRISRDFSGTAGSVITITGADGWYYNYFHLNNDTPGTDDGAAGPEWRVSPGLSVGSRVRAGQVIGYMGDSGNAEGSVPHLHFEIRQPDRTPVNPYHSLVAAQRRESCDTAGGWTNTDLAALSPDAVAIIPLDGGGRWVIDRDGRLHAEGPAANVAGLACDVEAPSVHAAASVADSPIAAVAAPAPEPAPAPQPAPVAAPAPEPAPAPQPAPVAAAAPEPAPAPQPAPVAAPAPEPAPATQPAPVAPAPVSDREWTVQPGESLWRIVQNAYGASDDDTTVELVNLVFEHNRDQMTDPSVLNVGVVLRLPAL